MNLPTPIDMMHLPALQRGDVQLFLTNAQNGSGAGSGGAWQTWVKPRGITMCNILAIGGGGGGGGGFQRTAGNPGGGGAGGACGGISRLLLPAFLLPDVLYVQVGTGGLGGPASTGGGGGTVSVVSFGRSFAAPNLLLQSNNSQSPGGGSAGSAGGGGIGGVVPNIPVTQPVANLGYWAGTVGLVGANGGAHTGANGVAVTAVWNVTPISQGAGGAGSTGTDFAGGAITLQGTPEFGQIMPTSLAGGTGAGANVDGNAGYDLWQPFFKTGGSGGGSNNSGVAGHGGKGGIGCGGGGGGAGATGGRGGDGGNGMVLIVSW